MRQDNEVLVVGAGPTGLCMAMELQRLGLRCRLIDKSQEQAAHSQALAVQSRTLEQLERYDVAEKLLARGRLAHGFEMISDGKPLVSLSFDQIPGRYPYVLVVPQNATEAILAQRLQELGGHIERGVELASCVNGVDCAHVKICHKNGQVEELAPRWVIGCDGAHSKVRETLGTEFSGETVPLFFYLADVELRGPAAPADQLRVYLHGGNAVFVARWSETMCRVVVILHQQPKPGSGQPTLADIQRALDEFAGGGMVASNPMWLAPFHINERKAEHYRTGNIFLAGDAAHIHSPVGGQGMNTGIQDAANLAWKLAAVENGADPVLLLSYDEERGGVGDAVLRSSSDGLAAVTTENPLLRVFRDLLLPHATQLPFVRKTILGYISETAIQYRHSSIVRDTVEAGALRSGDRAPNPAVHFRARPPQRLLDSFKKGPRLALAVNVKNEEAIARLLRNLPNVFLASSPGGSLLAGEVEGDLVEMFGAEPQIVLIRPDGYIGFRGSEEDVEALENYARLTGLPLPSADIPAMT